MVKHLIFALGAICLVSCTERIEPAGEITTRVIDVAQAIDGIEIGDGMTLVLDNDIPVGEAVIRTHENIQPYIKVETDRDRIIFTVDARRYRNLDVTVFASLSQYRDFTASGGSEIVSSGNVAFAEAEFELSGGSTAIFAGECGRAEIGCSGGSNFSGYDLSVQRAEVNVSGGSVLSLTVTGSLTGDNSGGSKIYYKGSPSIMNINNSGGSQTVACD